MGISVNNPASLGISELDIVSADKVLTGNDTYVGGDPGSLTLPDSTKVLDDQTYGVAGEGSTGTLTLPADGNGVLVGNDFGVDGSSIIGLYVEPNPADVLDQASGGAPYGAAGEYGTFDLTAYILTEDAIALVAGQAAKIVAGTDFGVLGEPVGLLAVADILTTGTGEGAGGTYVEPKEDDVLAPVDGGTAYGPGGLTEGKSTLPNPAHVWDTETYGSGGDGSVGTLAPAAAMLTDFGTYAAGTVNLSNCNIGSLTLTDCFGDTFVSSVDLSDNRFTETTLYNLIFTIHAAIVTGTSGATGALDVRGNVVPNAATLLLIADLAGTGFIVSYEGME